LEAEIGKLDADIARQAKENEVARRLITVPGIGPLIATAIGTLAPPPETFRLCLGATCARPLTPASTRPGTFQPGSASHSGSIPRVGSSGSVLVSGQGAWAAR
jgi:hypothetical protein